MTDRPPTYAEERLRACLRELSEPGEYQTEDFTDGFEAGFAVGFKEAISAYGIWRDGTQVIGCRETAVTAEIGRQFPG